MADAGKAKIMCELGKTQFTPTLATDAGDHKVFTVTGKTIFSIDEGYELEVTPNGVASGRNLITPHADAEKVSIAACYAYLAGIKTLIPATTLTVVRPTTDVAVVHSIAITAAGAYEVIAGTDGATSTPGTTRGEAGSPVYIPVDEVEIGQITLTSSESGVITAAEIAQTPGIQQERFDSPGWAINSTGDGDDADSIAQANAHVEFSDVIGDARHTGDTYKPVYLAGYAPTLVELQDTFNFVPAKNTPSTSSKTVYNRTAGMSSKSLGAASFSILLNDGLTDPIMAIDDKKTTFKFFPNRNKTAYSLTQGLTGIIPSYPSDNFIEGSVAIAAEAKTVGFSA